MKPIYFQIPKCTGETVRVQMDEQKYFYDNLHFHPEIQIMYIVEGAGTRFIGDSIGSFTHGDILVIGSNLPHVFRSDNKYYEHEFPLRSTNISVFFQQESFGESFLSLPEVTPIFKLLQNTRRGLNLHGRTKEKVLELVQKMISLEGFEKIICLLSILNLLSASKEIELLSSVSFDGRNKDFDSKKINDVFSYIMGNFTENITLHDASKIANMSVNAFCRYFKQHTRKTFSQFLNEIRIGHACRLLLEDKWNISETAFGCGYDSISYFNRQFKEITRYTPTEYVKLYREKHPQQF